MIEHGPAFIIGFCIGAAAVFTLVFMAAVFHFFDKEVKKLVDIYRVPESEPREPEPKKGQPKNE